MSRDLVCEALQCDAVNYSHELRVENLTNAEFNYVATSTLTPSSPLLSSHPLLPSSPLLSSPRLASPSLPMGYFLLFL
ncbi:hypothetical protein ACTXT7_015517, partial [Hymenolepis weldensis]